MKFHAHVHVHTYMYTQEYVVCVYMYMYTETQTYSLHHTPHREKISWGCLSHKTSSVESEPAAIHGNVQQEIHVYMWIQLANRKYM